MPDAKIAVMYQNDDFGKDVLNGLKTGLGDKADMIVAEASYEVAEPVVDSQVVKLKASGANVFINIATPKFAAQAIKKAHEIGWDATQIVANVSNSVGAVLTPAGLDASTGSHLDRLSQGHAGSPVGGRPGRQKDWEAFMDKYYPDGNKLVELHHLRILGGADDGAHPRAGGR
jgi:branched-chain amino acid transport system substrate-binding protein